MRWFFTEISAILDYAPAGWESEEEGERPAAKEDQLEDEELPALDEAEEERLKNDESLKWDEDDDEAKDDELDEEGRPRARAEPDADAPAGEPGHSEVCASLPVMCVLGRRHRNAPFDHRDLHGIVHAEARDHRIPEYGERLPPGQRHETRKPHEREDGAGQHI